MFEHRLQSLLPVKIIKLIALAGIVISGTIFLNGCTVTSEPRLRLGSCATSTFGTNFIDSNNLGRHCYENFLFENNGIAYTYRGGDIDIAHVRIAADYVRYSYNKVRKSLMNNDAELTLKLNVEPSMYFVKLDYPPDWKALPQKERERIADEVALELSQYFTYTMTTWHEVLTWFGYKCMGFLPEQPSAFSWEDIYSNIMGIRLGAQAVQDNEHGFNDAMTILIKRELENLGIQSRITARKASEKMRGIWFDGFLFIDMRERNMDIGSVDGFATPTLIPGVCKDVEPQSYPVPTLAKFNSLGFKMKLEVEPKEFEKNNILRIIYPNGGGKRIQPAIHLPIIMECIKKEALARGFTVMPPKHYR